MKMARLIYNITVFRTMTEICIKPSKTGRFQRENLFTKCSLVAGSGLKALFLLFYVPIDAIPIDPLSPIHSSLSSRQPVNSSLRTARSAALNADLP